MNLDQLQTIVNNGFASMREPDADVDKRIRTLEVMAGILKKEAENIKLNKVTQVDLNTLS